MKKIYCEDCNGYITKWDSCECGTMMWEIKEIEASNKELED